MSTKTDSDKLHIKPAREGLIVRDPNTGIALKAEGESKPRSRYWLKRLRDKDVVAVPPNALKRSRKDDTSSKDATPNSQPRAQDSGAKDGRTGGAK